MPVSVSKLAKTYLHMEDHQPISPTATWDDGDDLENNPSSINHKVVLPASVIDSEEVEDAWGSYDDENDKVDDDEGKEIMGELKQSIQDVTVWTDCDVFPQYGHAASADELNYHDPKVGNDDDSLTPQVPHVLVSKTPRDIHFGGGQQVSQEEGDGDASSSLVEEGKNLRRSLRGSLRKKGVVPKTLRRSLQGLRGSLKLH